MLTDISRYCIFYRNMSSYLNHEMKLLVTFYGKYTVTARCDLQFLALVQVGLRRALATAQRLQSPRRPLWHTQGTACLCCRTEFCCTAPSVYPRLAPSAALVKCDVTHLPIMSIEYFFPFLKTDLVI